MKDLEGKVCLVTGGSRGIGRAIVTAMADAGADVAFTYHHSKEQAEALAQSIATAKGVRCRAYQADVASPEAMQEAVRQVIADLGHIAILVNNAGINRDKSFLKMTRAMWDEVMRVNLDGVFFTTQLAVSDMVGTGWGRVINISSVVGQTGNFGQTNYAATNQLCRHKRRGDFLHRKPGTGTCAQGHYRQRGCPGVHRDRHGQRNA
jgi:NAD(P)-dependent dehydrogenase (short-subunit alcohol dehydrogenase family)